jgi:hypothetical protein
MMKEQKTRIEGQWLAEAIEAQGETLNSAAKLISVDSRLFYAHKAGKTTISTGVLFALCAAFPTLSERYVLTGRGPKRITLDGVDDDLVMESVRIRNSIERILDKLIA